MNERQILHPGAQWVKPCNTQAFFAEFRTEIVDRKTPLPSLPNKLERYFDKIGRPNLGQLRSFVDWYADRPDHRSPPGFSDWWARYKRTEASAREKGVDVHRVSIEREQLAKENAALRDDLVDARHQIQVSRTANAEMRAQLEANDHPMAQEIAAARERILALEAQLASKAAEVEDITQLGEEAEKRAERAEAEAAELRAQLAAAPREVVGAGGPSVADVMRDMAANGIFDPADALARMMARRRS